MTLADIRVGLRAHLLSDAAITAIVVDRVFPLKMPQGVTQASIVYARISGQGDHTMQGASDLARPRIQIASWAPSADVADALARLVKARIDGFRGQMGGVAVQGVFFDSEGDQYDDTTKLYGVRHDYFVWFEER